MMRRSDLGRKALSHLFAERFGLTQETAERLFLRIEAGGKVEFETADRIACFLGSHVDLLYDLTTQLELELEPA